MQQTETTDNSKLEQQMPINETQPQKNTPSAPGEYRVIRRNGQITGFDASKISVAMTKAFLAVEGGQAAASARIREKVENLTQDVLNGLFRRLDDGGTIHIEDIQDQVELALMRAGEHKVARDYVLYRAKQAEKRAKAKAKTKSKKKTSEPVINVIAKDGTRKALDKARLETIITEAVADLTGVDKDLIIRQAYRNIFDGIAEKDMSSAIVMCARQYIEKDPNYSKVAARLLLDGLRTEVLTFLYGEERSATQEQMQELYPSSFKKYIHKAIELELLTPELANYDLDKLGDAIKPERDLDFTYLGFQTLYDRYFIHSGDSRIELPQNFFMRVAMCLAINEVEREEKTIEFYNLLSSFDFMSSTPTLFNSGTLRPQLSSCYLTTVPDDLAGIFNAIKDDALLSKYAGGLGNDWSRVRGLGARIKGTNGESQGVVPFLKVANDTAVAVNQGGKRKGAMCAYLETWHIDIEEFLDLRKNTGDERRRTHDMNTANWIPDLFMQRVAEEQEWTLFSPEETPDLHDLYGQAFRKKYEYYEKQAQDGKISNFKVINANELWRKMLGMLFETGHPWLTFKDPCNIRSPQQHVGVIHSSNLCTEITLNTSDEEIAVCNLGSINLPQHTTENGLDMVKLEKTITTAMRMLDNVIDYNFYSVPQARRSNLKHRPVGIGLMGFQDALYKQNLAYTSEEAINFADVSMEAVSYFAIQASSDLAKIRGTYPSYDGSLWSKGILPIDSIELLETEIFQLIRQKNAWKDQWP
ncbi:MAG TPA: ribonucleoside-diphosphate reductase subunit alpha [Oceanospirillales bacterium]|nr:ribonucleoside-diphosphate reductase subunit alpha [Oceanospirillales bacterium]